MYNLIVSVDLLLLIILIEQSLCGYYDLHMDSNGKVHLHPYKIRKFANHLLDRRG